MNHPNGNEQPLRQSASEDAVANTSRGTNTSNKKKKRQRQVEDDAATQLPVATNNALLARQQLENEQHYQLLLSLQQQQQQQQMLQTLMVSNTNNNNTTNGNNSLRGAAASLAWDNSTATTPSSAMLLMHHAQRIQQQQHAATNQNMQQQQQHRGLTDGPFAQQVQGAHRAHHHFDQDESAVILPPGFLPQPFAPPEEVTPMMNPSVLWILQQQEQARRANMLMQAAFAGTSYSGLDTAPSNAITAITPRGILESPRDGRSVDLYMKTDDDILSDHQILIRKQIEFFEAGDVDISTITHGRRKEVFHGQVGIRCKHCRALPPNHRAKGSVFYPATRRAIYQAAQNMVASHFTTSCSEISKELKLQFIAFQTAKSSAGHGGKKYWSDGAAALGIVEKDDRLRFVTCDANV